MQDPVGSEGDPRVRRPLELAARAAGVVGDSHMGRPGGAAIEADRGGHALGPAIGVAILLVDADHVGAVGRVDLDPRFHLGVGEVGPRAIRRAPRQRVADRRVHRRTDAQRRGVGSGHRQHHHPDDPDNRTKDPGHHRHLPTETSPRSDGTPRPPIRHQGSDTRPDSAHEEWPPMGRRQMAATIARLERGRPPPSDTGRSPGGRSFSDTRTSAASRREPSIGREWGERRQHPYVPIGVGAATLRPTLGAPI